MNFASAEIAAWIGGFMWPLARVSAMVATMPLFGTEFIPVRVRLHLALAITAVIAPALPPMPQIDAWSAEGILVMFHQVAIGAAIGFVLQLLFAAFIIGGQTIAMQVGLGFASMIDPIAGAQTPVLGLLYTLMVGMLFLAFNGHLLLFELLFESFRLIPVGSDGLLREGLWALVSFSGRMFSAALVMAMTTLASLLTVMLAFGVVTKAAPQFNIFAVGMPIFMIMGFAMLTVTMPTILPLFAGELDMAFDAIVRILRGAA